MKRQGLSVSILNFVYYSEAADIFSIDINLCLLQWSSWYWRYLRDCWTTIILYRTDAWQTQKWYSITQIATNQQNIYIYIYIYIYTGCPRRNVPDVGRVFLMLKYTDITQNTYVQSWTVTEIMAREKCGLLAGPRTVPVSWQLYLCYVVECGIIRREFSSR